MSKRNGPSVDTIVEDTDDSLVVTVEADTVEQALAEVTTRYGQMTEIVHAEKVHRGGVGGFFAKERIRITARPSGFNPDAPAGVDAMFDRLAAAAEVRDLPFGSMLAAHMETNTELRDGTKVLFDAAGWAPDDDAPSPDGPDAKAFSDEAEPAGADRSDAEEPLAVGPLANETSDLTQFVHSRPLVIDHTVGRIIRRHRFPEPDDIVTVTVDSSTSIHADQLDPLARPDWVTELSDTALRTANGMPTQASQIPDVEAPSHPPTMVPTVDLPAWRLHNPAQGAPTVQWSAPVLARLGLPATIIDAVRGLDPNDEMLWIEAIADAVAPYCGALPESATVVAGPSAERLATLLDVEIVNVLGQAPYIGSFATGVSVDLDEVAWLTYVLGSRPLHLVIDERPWRDLLVADVVVASWIGDSALIDTLYLCSTLGAVLGFGTADAVAGAIVRATPLDVALTIRKLVGTA